MKKKSCEWRETIDKIHYSNCGRPASERVARSINKYPKRKTRKHRPLTHRRFSLGRKESTDSESREGKVSEQEDAKNSKKKKKSDNDDEWGEMGKRLFLCFSFFLRWSVRPIVVWTMSHKRKIVNILLPLHGHVLDIVSFNFLLFSAFIISFPTDMAYSSSFFGFAWARELCLDFSFHFCSFVYWGKILTSSAVRKIEISIGLQNYRKNIYSKWSNNCCIL